MHSSLFRAVARLDVLLRGILRGNFVDERFGLGLVGRVPVRDDFPALAVPLLYAPVPRALMVGAGNPDRLQHALEAEILDTCIREVEVLQTPADLLARQRLLAELFLRLADRLDPEHGVHHAAVVEDLADLAGLRRPLVPCIDVLLDVGMHGELACAMLKPSRLVACGLIACGSYIGLRARPPNTDHL